MPPTSLSIMMRAKIDQLFPQEQRAKAATLLEIECGDGLPLIAMQDVEGIERIRCAALKISEGSLEKLQAAVQLANTDWRDVLVAAGFASSVIAHLAWLENESCARRAKKPQGRTSSARPSSSLAASRSGATTGWNRPSRGARSMRTYQAEFPNARDECDIPFLDLQRQDNGTAGQSERSARFYMRLISSSARSRRSRSAVISTSLKSRGRLSTTQRVPMQLPSSRTSGTPA